MRLSLYIMFAIGCLFACQEAEVVNTDPVSTLGTLEHDFTISTDAQESFDKGLLLIHSFEYDDARAAFQEGKMKDSTEIMLYWGEAMSHYKALWGLQDKRAGYAVLEQIGETKADRLERIDDPIEKDFWQGVEILYGDGPLKVRNLQFNQHMKGLMEKYPGNQEAAAFYALSLMWDNENDEDTQEVGKRAAMIAEGILKENPTHPGALHYTIHAYDHPHLAENAMEVANSYAKVAPDATHALHMPSHIFLAQGMWDEVVASNEESYEASVKRMEKLGLTDEARGYHSYAWLHYGYLQQGREQDAIKLLKKMEDFFANTQSKGIRSYIASMQAAQLFETGRWPEGVNVLEIEKADLGLYTQMNEALFDAQMAIHQDRVEEVEAIIEDFKEEIRKAELYVSEDKGSMCSAGPSRYAPNEDAIVKAKVVLNQMLSMQALAQNNLKDAEDFMQKAVALESEAEYSSGPVDIAFPSFEMYGDFLLKQNRPEEAIDQYKESLERAPNRRKALVGLKEAYMKSGNEIKANEVDAILSNFNVSKSLTSL